METIRSGAVPISTKCRVCKGTGIYICYKCQNCNGLGQVLGTRRLLIPVPPAVQDMQTMRVEVEEEELFITFHVSNSSYFRTDGTNIHTDCVISLSQAVLGGTAKIEGNFKTFSTKNT